MAPFGKWFGSKPPAPPPAEPVDPAMVTGELIAEIRAQGITGEPRVEGDTLFIDDAGTTRHVFLGNLAREYAQAPVAKRAGIVAAYARLAARPVGLASPDLRARLLPKLTPRRDREALRAPHVANLLAGRAVAGGALTLELAVDEPEAVRVVTASDLAACKLTEEEAYVHALANLRRRSTQDWQQVTTGLLTSPWGDYFDGARLALPALIRGLPIKGTPIAVVANRNAVLVTGAEEPIGLALLAKATGMLMVKDRPVHVAPLVLEGDDWRPLDETADRAVIEVAPNLLFLSSRQDALDLAQCGGAVEAALRAQGFSHVAEIGMLDGEDLAATVADCPTGERVALPKVDLVRFGDALVAWYKLDAILGEDLAPLDVWPAHYELRRHPTAAELAAVQIRPG